MDESRDQIVVGIGELLWDCFDDARRPGGAPANVAFHAAQLGACGIVSSRVGRDAIGDELVEFLVARGLDVSCVQRDSDRPTGTVTVRSEEGQHPRFTIHEDVAWDSLTFDEPLVRLASSAAAICYGTLAQRSRRTRRAIEAVLDAATQALLVCDLNLRPPFHSAEILAASLHRCHVAKLNDDEVPIVADSLDLGEGDAGQVARAMMERYAIRLVAVTRGANGCLLVSESERVDEPGCAVDVVDTVGAGDAFTAALVCGLLKSWPLPRIARFANTVGGLVASRAGAMPSLRDEFAAIVSRQG